MESVERTTVGLGVVANYQMKGHCPQCETGYTNAPHTASVWLFGKERAWWSGQHGGLADPEVPLVTSCAKPSQLHAKQKSSSLYKLKCPIQFLPWLLPIQNITYHNVI